MRRAFCGTQPNNRAAMCSKLLSMRTFLLQGQIPSLLYYNSSALVCQADNRQIKSERHRLMARQNRERDVHTIIATLVERGWQFIPPDASKPKA